MDVCKQWLQLVMLFFFSTSATTKCEFFKPFNVTYDHRALILDGQCRILISAEFHYPRATPQTWPDLIAKTKECGIDVIQTYVFWNGHEPLQQQYNFEGQYDLVKFVKLVGASGLYLHLRIGQYVCAEWNFGGFPVWLRDIPGIVFRTVNAPFKMEPVMQLQCEDGYTVASTEFASYGTPQGSCQEFSIGNCHAPTSSSIVSKACEGRNSCKIEVSNSVFGDPCPGTVKSLAVKARCEPSSSTTT